MDDLNVVLQIRNMKEQSKFTLDSLVSKGLKMIECCAESEHDEWWLFKDNSDNNYVFLYLGNSVYQLNGWYKKDEGGIKRW